MDPTYPKKNPQCYGMLRYLGNPTFGVATPKCLSKTCPHQIHMRNDPKTKTPDVERWQQDPQVESSHGTG